MTLDVDRVLSHSRPPMWIRLQDHPATVLKHMAIINRNEADFSIVHVLLYTMADLEGVSRLLPPLGIRLRSHALQNGFLTAAECTKFGDPAGVVYSASWFKGDPTSKKKGRGGAQLPITQIPGSAPGTDCRCDRVTAQRHRHRAAQHAAWFCPFSSARHF